MPFCCRLHRRRRSSATFITTNDFATPRSTSSAHPHYRSNLAVFNRITPSPFSSSSAILARPTTAEVSTILPASSPLCWYPRPKPLLRRSPEPLAPVCHRHLVATQLPPQPPPAYVSCSHVTHTWHSQYATQFRGPDPHVSGPIIFFWKINSAENSIILVDVMLMQ